MTTLPGVDRLPRGADNTKLGLSQWFTPPATAERIARFAMEPWFGRGPNPNVLEPSCGDGALLRALGGYGLTTVMGLDLDPVNIEICRSRAWGWAPRFACADFLEWAPTDHFDLAVMNPPFEREQAMLHIRQALECCSRVIAHVPLTTLAGARRFDKLWTKVALTRLAVCASRPAYGPKGGQTDMCTVDVRMRSPQEMRGHIHTEVEWWP